jgi:crotonobetainyl-CoA:carnitine CoA-transferase CaiB-like acyl-CoA transferase
MSPLAGLHVVSLAINLPGPRAAQRFAALGARVTKIEPPQGDPVASDYPALYESLHRGQHIVTLDLKSIDGKARLLQLLADTDVLLASSRPRTLARLGLGWDTLHAHFPKLCYVAIVGFAPPDEDRPGHDLTYQAAAGLVTPPQLPRVLLADNAGAERAVSTALALLLARQQTGNAGYATVSLAEAAAPYADSIRFGATRDGGALNGGLPQYGVYQTQRGWIALAALENVFIESLKKALNLDEITRKSLSTAFLTRSAEEWEDWGRQHDIPIAVVANLEE